MLPLYRSVYDILTADATLLQLLDGDLANTHIYQTFVQFHSEAALRDHFWVTFNKLTDVADDTQQTQAIREVRLELHVFGRDASANRVDEIDDQVRGLLDGADLATTDLLAWFCLQEGPATRTYEVDQKIWHAVSVYHCKVAAVALLPT